MDRDLTDLDFSARHKLAFDIQGNELTPSARYDFKFKDYAPWVFRDLRKIFEIDAADYLVSLTGKYILSELGSPGKSGSFFYFSRDYRFIIKTLHHAEHRFLRKILREYHSHVSKYPNSMISQFYGLHRVKTSFGKKIHFVVMNNLFPPHMDIHSTYDVKGSTVGRVTTEESKKKNPRGTLKDLNWLQSKQTLKLPEDIRRLFLEQLQRDVELLAKLQIMDYSLLLGIHNMKEACVSSPSLPATTPERAQQSLTMKTPTSLVRTPSVSGQNYRHRDLRRMVTPSSGPITLSQLASSATSLHSHAPAGLVQPASSIDGTLNSHMQVNPSSDQLSTTASGGPPPSVGMQHNIFYRFEGGIRSQESKNVSGDLIYFLGIIDLLTNYGTRKRIEHFFKGLGKSADYKKQISAVPPMSYAARFRDFISAMTKNAEEIRQGMLERTPSAVNLERAMHEMDRENISPRAPPAATGTTISAVTEANGDIVLPVLEESIGGDQEQERTRQIERNRAPAIPRMSSESRRRPKGKTRLETIDKTPGQEEIVEPAAMRHSSIGSVGPALVLSEEAEHDGHDSGLANSLDCLPEETEPSRQSSLRHKIESPRHLESAGSSNTNANANVDVNTDIAPPLELDHGEGSLYATYATNGIPSQSRVASPAATVHKTPSTAEEKAARRKGLIGMPTSDEGVKPNPNSFPTSFSTTTNGYGGFFEDEGYEEGFASSQKTVD